MVLSCLTQTTGALSEEVSNVWVYVMGEVLGEDLKIGHHKGEVLRKRVVGVNREQTTNATYVLLAGVRGSTKDEEIMREYFDSYRRTDKGSHEEYFYPDPALVEYAAWLRGQWWTAISGDEPKSEHAVEDPSHWLPTAERRYPRPTDDPTKLVQDYACGPGALPGPWSWFPNPTISFQDFFTPPELIAAAGRAMGAVDLDAASHWAANRVHRIPDYFDASRSAFTNDWHGRVWLNPPYGDNGPWLKRATHFIETGAVEQLCMLSPVWAFSTAIATDFMRAASAMLLLSPTPRFWRNENALHTEAFGSNHPHAIVYVGANPEQFLRAFADFGIPMRLDQAA